MALGTFAIGTDGFVIAGVLPSIAHDVHVTTEAAGLLVTMFAVVYGLAAPVLTAASARTDRRNVLVVGMAVLSAANAVGAIAPSYAWLVTARVAAALGAAMYSPIALAAAVQVSPTAERGRAVSRVLAGMTMSLVLGVPLGVLLGSLGGWRWTFGFVAVVSAVAGLAVVVLLPRIPTVPTSSLKARLALLRRPAIVANLGGTFLWITGAFTAYTFIAPILAGATGWHGSAISALLLVYGAAAVAGNKMGGIAADRFGARRAIVFALLSLVASLSAVSYATRLGPPWGVPIIIAALVAWAGAGWSLTPAQSHRLVGMAPSAGPEVLSLNTSAVYLGIATGAALGGQVVTHFGPARLGFAAAVLQLLALGVVGAKIPRIRPHLPTAAIAVANPTPPLNLRTEAPCTPTSPTDWPKDAATICAALPSNSGATKPPEADPYGDGHGWRPRVHRPPAAPW
ncbi:MAG: MFS transporter [Acidimicrobiales bacterium]